MRFNRLHLLACTAALLAACGAPGPAALPAAPVKVEILAINDFHGNLEPPLGGIRIDDPAHPGEKIGVDAGGAAYLASVVEQLRAKNPNHVFVAAGDLIGASPLLSALFHDEPSVEALGLMGLEISAVGNHEFDKGTAELLRMQNGGCSPKDGCKGPNPYPGAAYRYLAASTIELKSGRTLFPPYAVKTFEGIPVAFIGLTLKGTPEMVTPAGVAGLEFRDEAETVNALVPELERQGVHAIVVLIHEGGTPSGDYDACPGISGPIVDIVKHFDRAVDVVVSGHTHRAYICRIDGRLVTSADKYGTLVTEIDLELDPRTRRVTKAQAHNVIVDDHAYAPDARQTTLIESYAWLARPLAQRVVGSVGAAWSRSANPAGESELGQLIADAQLDATRDAGAQIAFTNPGGIRAALAQPADKQLRYEALYAVQPFNNNLVTMTLSAAQLLRLLEQQWHVEGDGSIGGRVMAVSRGFAYRWDAARPVGARVDAASVTLEGRPIDPAARYRVTVNAFMASGGDAYLALKDGTERRTGIMDIDALELYVQAHPGLRPGRLDRITRLN